MSGYHVEHDQPNAYDELLGRLSKTAPGYCQCGCGELAPIATMTDSRRGAIQGRPRVFKVGHATKGRKRHRVSG